jgi:hypothetical protein
MSPQKGKFSNVFVPYYSSNCAGNFPSLDEEELRRQQERARALINEESSGRRERSRSRSEEGETNRRYRRTSPAPSPTRESCRDDPDRFLLETLRANFPALHRFPDYYILRQSASSLAKANSELENREGKGGRPSLETRLTRNYKNLEGKRMYLEAAYDDRLKEFHEGRFLPGPLCWLCCLPGGGGEGGGGGGGRQLKLWSS